jgi:hypothetical protein
VDVTSQCDVFTHDLTVMKGFFPLMGERGRDFFPLEEKKGTRWKRRGEIEAEKIFPVEEGKVDRSGRIQN